MDKVAEYFGTAFNFTFWSPLVPNFERAFTVGRLRLTRVELKDGTTLEPPRPGAPTKHGSVAAAWDTPIRFGTAPKDGALTTSLRLFLDAKTKPEDIKALRGVVTVQFAQTLHTLHLEDLSPGRGAGIGDLTVTVAARNRKGFTLRTNKDGDRLLYARVTSPDGQAVAFFGPNVTESPEGAWRFELSPLGASVGADVIVAGELDRKDYPFTLVPRQ